MKEETLNETADKSAVGSFQLTNKVDTLVNDVFKGKTRKKRKKKDGPRHPLTGYFCD